MNHPIQHPPDKGERGGFGTDGDFRPYVPYDPRLVDKARENRKNPTEPERRMWQILCRKQFLEYKFLRQKPLNRFIVDFYCPKLALAIEIDGDTHALQENYDRFRSERLAEFEIKVIRYTNTDVMRSIDSVFDDLILKIRERETELSSKATPLQHRNPSCSPYQGSVRKSP